MGNEREQALCQGLDYCDEYLVQNFSYEALSEQTHAPVCLVHIPCRRVAANHAKQQNKSRGAAINTSGLWTIMEVDRGLSKRSSLPKALLPAFAMIGKSVVINPSSGKAMHGPEPEVDRFQLAATTRRHERTWQAAAVRVNCFDCRSIQAFGMCFND